MPYIKILLSIPLLLIALLGVIMTFANPFDIFNVIITLIFLVPGYVLASKGIKEIKARKSQKAEIDQGTDQQMAAVVEQVTEPVVQQKQDFVEFSDKEVLDYVQSLSGFPEVDEKGMKILKILEDVRLSGVTREYEGMDPQETIEMLSEGEEVFFKRIPMKKYPNAILVVDCSDNPIGWIPEDFFYQEDIAQRLDDGTTVKGRVSTILGGEEGKSYGVRIDIARYTKKREKK
jgi:hypothetical protein